LTKIPPEALISGALFQSGNIFLEYKELERRLLTMPQAFKQ